MPKGRGSNERRRSHRQKHPKDRSEAQGEGRLKQNALIARIEATAKKRRKAAGAPARRVAAVKKASQQRAKARRTARKEWA